MKITNSIPFLLVISTFLSTQLFTFGQASDFKAVYKLESLKYVYTIQFTGSAEALKGTFSSDEYGEGQSEKISFTGVVEGDTVKVKLEKNPQFCAMTAADENGVRLWNFSSEHKTIFIPIHSRDEEGKDVIANMPLELVR